jgi:hypothetical protein
MLRLAQTAALVCCDREIGGMTERQERAETYMRSCSGRRPRRCASSPPIWAVSESMIRETIRPDHIH